jgi:hypothetical protein
MFFENHSSKLLEAPLAEVLEKLYPVDCIADLYHKYFLPISTVGTYAAKAKKSAMVEALVGLANDHAKLRLFCDQMPAPVQKALATICWLQSCPVEELETNIGKAILIEKPDDRIKAYGRLQNAYDVPPEFDLLVFVSDYYSFSRYGASQYEKKSRISVCLPSSLRSFFKHVLPKPPHAELIPLESWDAASPTTHFYDAKDTLMRDLQGISDTFRRGKVLRTKAGAISKGTLKEFKHLVHGREFFQDVPKGSEDLINLRIRLLAEFFNHRGKTILAPEEVSLRAFSGFVKATAKHLLNSQTFVLDVLLPHLRPEFTGAQNDFFGEQLVKIIDLFRTLPEGKWISAENLRNYCRLHEMDSNAFKRSYVSARNVILAEDKSPSYYHANRTDLTNRNFDALVIRPILDGMAFLLGSLGFLEIAYTDPSGCSPWRTNDSPFLTPFDGLEAMRLTPVGAFAFGRRADLQVHLHERTSCQLHLHPERLLIRATDLDPLTEKALREFLVELEPGFYRLERKRFLSGCADPEAIKSRVQDFQRRIPAKLPPFWKSYLDELTAQTIALHPVSASFIYQLADDPALIHLITNDPELRRCCLRVEGRRVAIAPGDFTSVRKRLLKAGFFM